MTGSCFPCDATCRWALNGGAFSKKGSVIAIELHTHIDYYYVVEQQLIFSISMKPEIIAREVGIRAEHNCVPLPRASKLDSYIFPGP